MRFPRSTPTQMKDNNNTIRILIYDPTYHEFKNILFLNLQT